MRALLFILLPCIAIGQEIAFPSAKGFGKYASGGRGGQIVHVTNLNNSGAGSLREAIQNTYGPRTIVFDVGGVINLQTPLYIGSSDNTTNDNRSNLTIAGETAPWPGITLQGSGIDLHAKNVIIRYLTIRVDNGDTTTQDCLTMTQWEVTGETVEDVIVDHLTLTHGEDENVGIARANGLTIQHSIIGSPLNNYNVLMGPYVYNFTMYGNYLSHAHQRNVLVGYGIANETSEYINNIIYGYWEGMYLVYGNVVDVLGNVYKRFNGDGTNSSSIGWSANGINNPDGVATDGAFYVSDNFSIGNAGNLYNANVGTYGQSSRVITNSEITNWATTVADIEDVVFGNNVGNSLYADAYEAEKIADYYAANGDHTYDAPAYHVGTETRPASDDSDDDDMIDAAEIAVFGSITHTDSPLATDNHAYYTNIELTHHYLAGDVEETPTSPEIKKTESAIFIMN